MHIIVTAAAFFIQLPFLVAVHYSRTSNGDCLRYRIYNPPHLVAA